MKLTLQRKQYTPLSTCGELHVDDKFFCFTLERPHPDIKGAVAPMCIPSGTFQVRLGLSPSRQIMVPWLLAVPGRTDIQIHIGNFPKDTEGCILVGNILGMDYVGDSRTAFEKLIRMLQGETDVYITIN